MTPAAVHHDGAQVGRRIVERGESARCGNECVVDEILRDLVRTDDEERHALQLREVPAIQVIERDRIDPSMMMRDGGTLVDASAIEHDLRSLGAPEKLHLGEESTPDDDVNRVAP